MKRMIRRSSRRGRRENIRRRGKTLLKNLVPGCKEYPRGTRYFNGEPFTIFGRAAKTREEAEKIAEDLRRNGFRVRIVKGTYEYPLNPESRKGDYWYLYVNNSRERRR